MGVSPQFEAVVSVFLERPDSALYGLEIAKAVGLATGTVYPILARLERAGWIEGTWEQIDPSVEGRRPRRYYRLQAVGRKEAREALVREAERLESLRAVLDAVAERSSTA